MDKLNTKALAINNREITSSVFVNENDAFSVQKLIQAKEDKRKKVLIQYNLVYDLCINKITQANILGLTDIIYEVPDIIFGLHEYSPVDCLEFLERKLRLLKIDTYKVPPYSLFISWYYIEINKKDNSED